MIFDIAHKTTGETYYMRLIMRETGYVWNTSTNAWASDTSWANSAISLTETPDSTGDFPMVAPTTLTGSGNINAVVYLQDGVSPANTDEVSYGGTYKLGSIFGF